ncbi:hypothetical protein ONZ51_g10280 [Trametes cubensis]|uniref:Uncharacterized protein n=1 Tax=Trametes cubensis TaxID=1111947 RepID=A0AAD7TMC8_9APHY|nr:hypothetical protein ONZ51_g10280 [Trametes cubensis]
MASTEETTEILFETTVESFTAVDDDGHEILVSGEGTILTICKDADAIMISAINVATGTSLALSLVEELPLRWLMPSRSPIIYARCDNYGVTARIVFAYTGEVVALSEYLRRLEEVWMGETEPHPEAAHPETDVVEEELLP